MIVALGIDTGGTYTDAVLMDHAGGTVLAGAKALTTRHDLSVGIGQAVAAAFKHAGPQEKGMAVSPADVKLVALSTTLATNAIVEGHGSPVCLLLIGYDRELVREFGFERDPVTRDLVFVRGGHNWAGDEVEPLDEDAIRGAVLAWRDKVEAFAVSGYFGVRNPAHELRARALIEELTASIGAQPGALPLPVTCGHELTSHLNAPRRAMTVALNARLIPVLRELVATVRRTLDELGIAAPLMIVKGDGSLVQAEWAMRRPIETILSGPAASAVGAWHLAGRRDAFVVDMGGTTTDIAVLRDGRPRLNPEGAQVGGRQTMVEAVDVHTVGLGGDSHVRLRDDAASINSGLVIGPGRVVPLCLLASEHPQIVQELGRQRAMRKHASLVGQFVLAQRHTANALSDEEQALLNLLAQGPQSLIALVEELRYSTLAEHRLRDLEARRLVLRAGFTPTDALHVLGRFEHWNVEAAGLGAELMAAQIDLSPRVLCERVVAGMSDRVVKALISKVLSDEARPPDWEREPSTAALLARALGGAAGSDLDCQIKLRRPVVAIGAPVVAYFPRVAELLSTELVIPPHAEVANAVGAVAGSVVQQLQVMIRPLDGEQRFRVHLPDKVLDFSTLEEGVAFARQAMPIQLEALAQQVGADRVQVHMTRVDHVAPVKAGWGQTVYLDTELTFTAVGRPGLGDGRGFVEQRK